MREEAYYIRTGDGDYLPIPGPGTCSRCRLGRSCRCEIDDARAGGVIFGALLAIPVVVAIVVSVWVMR